MNIEADITVKIMKESAESRLSVAKNKS